MITRRQIAFVVFLFFCSELVNAQPLQREWVRNYSHLATKTNQPIAIAIAPDGNVVVAGFSQNAEGDLDYQIIKYKPTGEEAWKVRYGSPADDQLRAMAIDPAGNIIVTGTSDTVKYRTDGSFVWVASLSGRALIANSSFVYVTGFSDTDIATAQIENSDVDDNEIWRRIIDGPNHGPDIGQAITLDVNNNVFIAGQVDYAACQGSICHKIFGAISYTPGGTQRWFRNDIGGPPARAVQVKSILVHPDQSIYLYGTYGPPFGDPLLVRLNSNGSMAWAGIYFGDLGTKMILDKITGRIVVTGRRVIGLEFAAMVVSFLGNESEPPPPIWTYLGPPGGATEGSDIAQDSAGNFYITGYSPNDFSSKATFLAKLDSSGKQLGLDRYNSPSAGSNFGTALAIDTNDNVYVTGYVLNTNGGSEFVTIKYSAAPTIEKKANGAMHLEFHTIPGQQYAIEATADFLNWQSLITNTADITGLIQFDDEQAPAIPYRFYRGNSSP